MKKKPSFGGWKLFLVILILGLTSAALIDLYLPMKYDIRYLPPKKFAQLETKMWKLYYEKKPEKFVDVFANLLRKQYGFPYLRSYYGAYLFSKAAFTFKKGRSREDYEKAIPYLRRFFRRIHEMTFIQFDVNQTAKSELEWWIIHRQRYKRSQEELVDACALVISDLYSLPKEKALPFSLLRVQAMQVCDAGMAKGGAHTVQWKEVESLLEQAYHALNEALSNQVSLTPKIPAKSFVR